MKRIQALTALLLAFLATSAVAADETPLKILLLGDSTSIGSVCRLTNPQGPHLEDVIRLLLAAEKDLPPTEVLLLLAAEKDLPPTEVLNQGRDGEFIHGLLESGRYDREIAKIKDVDFVLIRYGLNDLGKRQDFDVNFPKDYSELIARLRKDFPDATIIPVSIIPYMAPEADERMNAAIRKVAEAEKLPLLDLYPRCKAELSHGPNMLNYRRYPLAKIPEKHRALVKPFVVADSVTVMDNRLDAHFRDLPGWFGDRHPNLAGYHVIGDETAKFLAKLIRERKTPAPASTRGEGSP